MDKNKFLHSISNYLCIIDGKIELVEKKEDAFTKEEIVAMVHKMRAALDKAIELVDEYQNSP